MGERTAMTDRPEGIVHIGGNANDIKNPVEGSTTETCAECGHTMWITEGSIDYIHEQHPGVPITFQCGRCYVKEHGVEKAKDLYMRIMLGLDLPDENIAMPNTGDIIRDHLKREAL